MHPGKALSRARREFGLTLRKLAAFANTSSAAISQIETGQRGVSFERLQSLLELTGHRLVVIHTNARTPVEISEHIGAALTEGNLKRAFQAFIVYSKTLKSIDPGVRLALTLGRPDTTGDPVYDAAIASLVEHWLSIESLPIPKWVDEDSFIIPRPTYLGELTQESVPLTAEIPQAFLKHNVLFPVEALENVNYLTPSG